MVGRFLEQSSQQLYFGIFKRYNSNSRENKAKIPLKKSLPAIKMILVLFICCFTNIYPRHIQIIYNGIIPVIKRVVNR